MRKQVMFLTAAVALASGVAMAGPGDWAFLGKVDTPLNNSGAKTLAGMRLGMDTNGNAYLAHYGDSQMQVYLVKFAPPTGPTLTVPAYTRVHEKYTAVNANGIMGMVPDASGGMYFALDIGNSPQPNYIGRVNADGTTGTLVIDTTGRRINAIGLNTAGELLAFPLLGGAGVWRYDATTGAPLADVPITLTGNIRDAVKVTVAGVDKWFINRSGNLQRLDLAAATVEAGLVDGSNNPITFTDTASAGTHGVAYFPKDDTVIYLAHDNVAVSARSNIYVVDPATRQAVQVIDGLEETTVGSGVGKAVKPGDAICYTVGTTDYMLVTQSSQNSMSVFSKPTTPAAAVNEWSLY